MRRCALRWCWVTACSVLLGIPLLGQSGMERNSPAGENNRAGAHLGYPQDWSSSHILMLGMRADDVLEAGVHEPRHVYNMVMREVAIQNQRRRPRRPRARTRIDWAVSLENGYIPQNQFPAKYQFDVTLENCNTDYVVFGLTGASNGQANLVGINNVYTSANPPCNNGSPWVSFAFNAVAHGGQIKTSPVLSEDGTKIAFVESTNGASYFHVLVLPNPIPSPPSQAGTVLHPLGPVPCTSPTTPFCMTTLTIVNNATNTNSSPWVDYSTDTAYVGADNGILYKITPVFGGGVPTKISTGGWPVTVSTQSNKVLTAPVVDDTADRIFLGDGYGYLYAVSLSSPGGTYAARQNIGWVGNGAGTGVVDPPIVVTDPANPATDQVFAFTGCSSVLGIGGAVSQLPADFVTGTPTTSNTVDLGSRSGQGDCTGNNVHSGTFDNEFWLAGSTSGHLIVCGFQSGTTSKPLKPSNPKMYFFPFASNVITGTGSSSFVINTTLGDECSPLTEFYDGTTDRLFFGVGSNSDGYVEGSTITTSLATPVCSTGPTSSCVKTPNALEGTSGIVIDNLVSNGGTNIYLSTLAAGSVNGQKCNVSGGTANPKCAVKLTQSGLQ